MSRRDFLKLGGAGFAGATLVGVLGSPTQVLAAPLYPPDVPFTYTPMQPMSRPPYRTSVRETTYGTTVRRIADKATFNNAGQITFNPNYLRHFYSKKQPWNADGSKIILDYFYPPALLDGRTYQLIRLVRNFPCNGRWSNLDPNIAYGDNSCGNPNSGNQLIKWDVRTEARTVKRTFGKYQSIWFDGYSEGNLSDDDRYMAMLGYNNNGASIEAFVYDMVNNVVVSRKPLPYQPDYVTMSPSGNYVIISWDYQDPPNPGRNHGTEVFDRNFDYLRKISLYSLHSDYGHDTAGNEVSVRTNDSDISLVMVQLDTGQKTTLLPADKVDYNIHVSCRNIRRPGWAYVSQYGSEFRTNPTYQTVFAVKLDGSGTVEFFTKEHHSSTDAYEREPHAVPNRDGSIVMWASDWERTEANALVYSYVAYQR